MRALKYFLNEATESLLRSWRSASLAILTIAAGLFVLGFFLMVNDNLQRVVGRWSEAAEMSIYLKDEATREQVQALEALIDQTGVAAERKYLSKTDALARFREDFPDLAGATERLDRNPLPASLEVRLGAKARGTSAAVDDLAARLGSEPGVADVRYDRRWLSRLGSAVRFVRTIGLVIVALLAVAAALTVANVVRLAAYARLTKLKSCSSSGRRSRSSADRSSPRAFCRAALARSSRSCSSGEFSSPERPGTGSWPSKGSG